MPPSGVPGEPAETSDAAARPAGRPMLRLVGGLSLVNILVSLSGIVTGPLQARALGPTGRGTLAAILVPVTLAPVIAGLGLGSFAIRDAARGRPVPVLVGTLGVPLLVVSGVVMLGATPLAHLIAGDRAVVFRYVRLGLFLMPFSLTSSVVLGIAVGLERWRMLIVCRLVAPTIWTVGVVVLYATDRLTVSSAAILTFVGAGAASLPMIPLLRLGRPRFDREVLREALPFGAKAWLGGLSAVANVNLDQLLMIRLVSARELGLYAIAVTVATAFTTVVVGALSYVIAPRIAAGDRDVAARATRMTLASSAVVAAGLALPMPLLLRIGFGEPFDAATAMTRVALVASVPLAAAFILGTALVNGGHPGVSAKADLFALLITVPGLAVFLPLFGGVGAASVSLCAYTAAFAVLLVAARRRFDLRIRELVVPRAADLAWLSRSRRRAAVAA